MLHNKMIKDVVLSGVDGSGKTTISKLLALYFHSKGKSVCIHWFRGSHLFASILAQFLSHFRIFYGNCNPYYKICIPRRLRGLWIHLEFWSLLPHVFARIILRKLCNFLVCDRGLLDFIAWIITTLNFPRFLRTVYGRFLLRLAIVEKPIYLYANVNILFERADVPSEYLIREVAVYNVLARYVSPCRINTGSRDRTSSLGSVLECLNILGH